MLSPYSGSIYPLSSTSIAKYINFVKLQYNKRLDCSVANRNLIFAGLVKKAEQYSMAILQGSYLRYWQDGQSSAHHQHHQLDKC